MIILLSLKTEINKDLCFSHLEFPFVARDNYSKLQIKYSYTPKEYDGKDACDMAERAFKEAYGKAPIDILDVKNELPLKNHVTLSLSQEGKWIGTAHRHANDMIVEISSNSATEGFHAIPIINGQYSVTLSVHALLSEKVCASIEVVAYE